MTPFEAVLLEEPVFKEGKTLLHLKGFYILIKGYTDFHYGDRLKIDGEIDSQGVLKYPKVEKLGQGQGNYFYEKLLSIRKRLTDVIKFSLPEPQATLLSGVLLGEVGNFSKDFYENLQRSGTIHVVVVSGYNISVITGLVMGLTGTIRRRYAVILMIGIVILYTFLTGAQIPTIRAAIMSSVVYLAGVFGRAANSVYLLFLVAILMMALNPSIAVEVSFQLSFLATLGVLTLTDKFSNYLSRLPRPFKEDLATSLAAQALVLPVIFYHFGQISLISPIVNGLILWLVPLVTFAGMVLICLGILILPLAQIFAWLVWFPLTIFVLVVNYSGSLPIASISVTEKSWWLVVGFYLVTLSFWLWQKLKELKQT
ncbi:MAG: ComEC/Rec2 family competence protein [Patescibacteria group bacterium]|nr:ComEC/Rec2 family competence protein [Patescibacteria group bacterium]